MQVCDWDERKPICAIDDNYAETIKNKISTQLISRWELVMGRLGEDTIKRYRQTGDDMEKNLTGQQDILLSFT